MKIQTASSVAVPSELLDAIRAFPTRREIEHCGRQWAVSPFDIYTNCPECGAQIKLRSFAAVTEIEDVFDAVIEWMCRPGAEAVIQRRRDEIQADADE